MHIQGTSHIHGPQGINAPHSVYRGQSSQAARPGATVDRVEISAAAAAASQASETGAVRQSLVDNIKAQIAAGTYETPDKLESAIERMLDEIV
jgi:negative regulator of flagellin synthesis FlgM